MSALMVYVTYPDAGLAKESSRAVVEARLAACANILPAHQSLYWWEGAVQDEAEVAVIYKTTDEKFGALKDMLIELHSYEVPCVVAWPITQGHDPFLAWIKDHRS